MAEAWFPQHGSQAFFIVFLGFGVFLIKTDIVFQ